VVRTVLVYSMGEVIGDGLIKLPFVGALRRAFPDAHIAWAAAKGETVYAGPLKAVVAGAIDEIVTEGPTGAGAFDWLPWVRPFGGRKFDLVIDTQENAARAAVARRAASGLFISPAGNFRLSQRRPAPGDADPWPTAVVDRFAKLLSLATGRPETLSPLPIGDARTRAAAEALLPAGPTYIGFAPGAGGQDKRWPLASFLALAERQITRGRTPVMFFGPDEAGDVEQVRAALGAGVLLPEWDRTDDFRDVRGPALVVAMAGRLAAAVANDAGPGHMLAAGGAALVSLQTDRRRAAKFRPAAPRLELLCAEDYGAGMTDLPIDAVDAALERLLGAGV
jgi:ADP-heptose:LPS heptosyltransferase